MDTKSKSASHSLEQMPEYKIEEIFNSIWETAVHTNPMALVKIIDPSSTFKQLRTTIRDCLAKGLSEVETREHVLQELLQASVSSRLLVNRCDDPASPDSSHGQHT
jgi:hypothetical protein